MVPHCINNRIYGLSKLNFTYWIILFSLDDLKDSCSNIGFAYDLPAKYKNPENKDNIGIGMRILAGKFSKWTINEIEVFHLEMDK